MNSALCRSLENTLRVTALKSRPLYPEKADQVLIAIPVDIPFDGTAEGHAVFIPGASEGDRIEIHDIHGVKFAVAEDCHRE